jgi:archaellum biogenesis ATPase FlaH
MGGARPNSFRFTTPGTLRLYSTAELIGMDPPRWQIEGIVPEQALLVIYGQPGAGKSFIAMDMGLSIASSIEWQGKTVEPGWGLYISGEGNAGVGKRALAFSQARGIAPRDIHMMWLTEPIVVTADSEMMDRLLERVNREVQIEPSFIVIDTLARCFDGDENKQEDMGRFVAGVDKLRATFNATVCVVHHTRLDGDRERGNTALRGAADTMISVRAKGKDGENVTVSCNKQKDHEEFKPMGMLRVKVDGTDSCAMMPGRGMIKDVQERKLLNVLIEQKGTTWDEWFEASGLSKTTFQRYFAELRKSRAIIKENGIWRAI